MSKPMLNKTLDLSSKECFTCKKILPATSFSKDLLKSTGLHYECRECRKVHRLPIAAERAVYNREFSSRWYQENRERIREQRRIKQQEVGQERLERNRGKNRARSAVRHAVKRGLIEKMPCIACGNLEVQAHHHLGYSEANKLKVEWLCRS